MLLPIKWLTTYGLLWFSFPKLFHFVYLWKHCRFCEDCFIIFVYHLLHSIWCLARIFASILSDINKIQPVHRLSSSTFASLMFWKIILLCSRQLEKPEVLIVNQCVRSAPLFPLVIYSNAFLVRWQRPSMCKMERAWVIFLPLSTLVPLLSSVLHQHIPFKVFVPC